MVTVRFFPWLRQLGRSAAQAVDPSGRFAGLPIIVLLSLTAAGLGIGMGHLGWLQPLELRAYDWMLGLRQDEGPDPRLLVVAITEEDLQTLQQPTPSDAVLAQALANIERYRPRAIGIDLYRDVPIEPGNAELQLQLQSPRVVAITKLGDTMATQILPPPGIPPERVGFNDLLIDGDGVIRRNLLFASTANDEVFYSFSLRLALQFLAEAGIQPQSNADYPDYVQLGPTIFPFLEANFGSYRRLDAAGYQILLNYRSPDRAIQQVSLTQVLQNQVSPDSIRDRVVLIGTTAESGKDLFYTPYSVQAETDHQMPGVVIHGQMVSQILSAALDQRPLLWVWPDWAEMLWISGWAIISGGLAWTIRHPLALALSGVGGLGAIVFSSFALFTQAGWVPVIGPGLVSCMASGAVVAYRAQQAQRQQQMVMSLLGQNTSPEIAAALWQHRDRLLQDGKLPGQRLTATLLFIDIKDFSTTSEQMSPEALLDWLNEYLEEMTQTIQNHQGIVNKFTGDGLLAVFGVPMPHLAPEQIAHDARQAVACALAMGDRLQQLNQQWQQRNLVQAEMRVGIFTGPVVVGSLGGKHRLEYGVIGDSVNIASRLESCVKERQSQTCRVLIAHETLVHLQDQFAVESWGPMALKGKHQLVDVYRVISPAAADAALMSQPADSTAAATLYSTEPKQTNVNL